MYIYLPQSQRLQLRFRRKDSKTQILRLRFTDSENDSRIPHTPGRQTAADFGLNAKNINVAPAVSEVVAAAV